MRNSLRTALLVAIATSLCAIAHAGIYKYIDENGQIAYGDRPVEGAKKIKIRRRPAATEGESRYRNPHTQGAGGYHSLEVLSPRHDKVISDRTAAVEVILLAEPSLGPEDDLIITVDGKDISRGKHANLSLSQVPRGTHTVGARIVDASGNVKITSPTITFHVKRP